MNKKKTAKDKSDARLDRITAAEVAKVAAAEAARVAAEVVAKAAAVGSDGWNTYQRLVIDKLDTNTGEHAKITGLITDLRIDLAALKVKSGVWGFAAGAIPVALALLGEWLLKK